MKYTPKRFPLFLFFSILALWVTPVRALEIAVVQTSSAAPYEKSFQGLLYRTAKATSPWGQKSISPDTTARIILSEEGPTLDLHRKLRGLQPDIIIAIGRNALLRVMGFPDVPIIHVLAPFPPDEVQNSPNIIGVDLNLSPAKQLSAFLDVFPAIKRIGTIYDPAETGKMVRQAQDYAVIAGVDIMSLKAGTDKEAIQQIAFLQGSVDALWMLPDRSILSPIFVEALLAFSFENRVPLLTFADKYLEMGATLSLAADPYAMGEQAGLLALQTLELTMHEKGYDEYVETATVRFNEKIARKIGAITNMAALEISPAQRPQ